MTISRRGVLGLFAALAATAATKGALAQTPYDQSGYQGPAYNADGTPARAYMLREQNTGAAAVDVWSHRPVVRNVTYTGPEAAGTIVIDHQNNRLYLVQAGGQAREYVIAVGREGSEIEGDNFTVSRKAVRPSWTPTPEIARRMNIAQRTYAGGDDTPLGSRALYLGNTLYRIHGTNQPHLLGQKVSSGCIRLHNYDIIDLYDRVPVGARVVVSRTGIAHQIGVRHSALEAPAVQGAVPFRIG